MSMRRQSGFTLIELVVTVAVLAILLVAAVPSFEAMINSNRLSTAANELVASLQAARSESLRYNKRTVVCLSANPDAASPTCTTTNPTGWITFLDNDSNASFGTGDVLLRATTINSQVSMLGSAAFAGAVSFRADGLARNAAGNLINATLDMCIPTIRPAQNRRHVSIGSGSRISVVKAGTAGACSTVPSDSP